MLSERKIPRKWEGGPEQASWKKAEWREMKDSSKETKADLHTHCSY